MPEGRRSKRFMENLRHSIYYDLIIQSLGDLIPRVLKIAGQGSAEEVTDMNGGF